MSEEPGPIVVDPHAFDSLWPALLVWLLLFVTAGDAVTVLGRQAALQWGAPATAVVSSKRRGTRRALELSYEWDGARRKTRENVGAGGWARAAVGSRREVHVLRGRAYLDDDFGYSRWKLALFGVAWIALWLWAAARYRFG